MQNKLKVLILFLFCASIVNANKISANESNWHNNRQILITKKSIQRRVNIKKYALKMLDKVLSPFEDITEYALAGNKIEITKSLRNIENIRKLQILKKVIRGKFYHTLDTNIEQLQHAISKNNYTKTATISISIFHLIINNFLYEKYIRNQLYVEKLDEMGFKVLSILKYKKIDYSKAEKTVTDTKQSWLKIRAHVDDRNLRNAFDLLFEALELNIKHKDIHRIKILASMDLALVDIIEKKLK